MLCNPAQYLLRFDDLCPTISREPWRALTALIAEYRLHPILAIVPENRDPELQHSLPDPEFWANMRKMQTAGAVVALHGYRHLSASPGRSLIPLARYSEFAGMAPATQRTWIREGLRILRAQGLNPRLWVAPRHGFDQHTLHALIGEGIAVISDGLARTPILRDGVTWIPQQLWAPCNKSKGLWTICIHPNTATAADIEALRAFIRARAAQCTSLDRVLADFPPQPLSVSEAIYARLALLRIQSRRWRNRTRPC